MTGKVLGLYLAHYSGMHCCNASVLNRECCASLCLALALKLWR